MAKLKVIFDAEISKVKAAIAALKKDTSDLKKEINKPARGNFSSLVSGAKSAAGKIKGFFVGAMAVLGVSAGASAIKDLVSKLDNIGKSSRNIGVTAEEFQKLTYAAESVNFPAEQLNMVFTKVRQTVGDAARGVQSAEDKLAAIGLRSQDLVKLRPYEQFQKIAEALRGISDPAERASASVAMFGEQGLRMTNFLQEFESLGQQLAQKGAIIPDQAIADAEEFTQQLTNIQRLLQSFAVRSGFLRELREIAEGLEAIATNAKKMQDLGVREKKPKPKVYWNASQDKWIFDALGKIVGKERADGWFQKLRGAVPSDDDEFDLITDAAPERKERDRLRKIQKENAARKQQEAEEREKLRQQAKAAQLAKVQQAQQQKSDKSVRSRLDEMYKKLRYQQLINNGLGKEAAILQEIDAAEKAAGRKLTADEEKELRSAAGFMYDLRQKDQKKVDTVAKVRPEIYSDSLLRMGGRIGAIGNAQDYNRKTFDRLGDIRSDLRDISNKMGGSLTFD